MFGEHRTIVFRQVGMSHIPLDRHGTQHLCMVLYGKNEMCMTLTIMFVLDALLPFQRAHARIANVPQH